MRSSTGSRKLLAVRKAHGGVIDVTMKRMKAVDREDAFPAGYFTDVDVRPLAEVEDFSTWTEEDFDVLEMQIDYFLANNLGSAYSALVARIAGAKSAVVLTRVEQLAAAAFSGVPLELDPKGTNIEIGLLRLRPKVRTRAFVDAEGRLVVAKQARGEEPERTGD